jgi:hypothetical protein
LIESTQGYTKSARALTALVALCASSLSAQAPGVPGPMPPLSGGYSVVRVELPRVRRFTLDDRAWTPVAHVDVAIGNSPNRLAASVARYSSAGGAVGGSLGGGLTFTRVVRETESPAWITWFTIGAGTLGLGSEGLPGSRVYELAVSAGAAKRFTPPGIREILLTLAPRYVWLRMTDPPAGMDRSAERIGGSLALDIGSQGRLGGLVALDVDWSSWPPHAVNQLQAAFRFGASYRFLLFSRAHPVPPEE